MNTYAKTIELLTPRAILIYLPLFFLSFIGSAFQQAHAEMQFSMNGQLHTSFQIKGEEEENFYLDRAWLGFDAYTPQGFGHLTLQLDKADLDTTPTNAIPQLIREAYTGIQLGENWRFMLGMKDVPHGMPQQDDNSVLGIESVNYLMGLKQATGIQLQFKQDQWIYDFGLFNPAYRAEFISTDLRTVSSLSKSPLLANRISYQAGKLLTMQASFSLQEYKNDSTFSRTFYATRYYDVGMDIDFSQRWGMTFNYSQVEYAYGSSLSTPITSSLIQVDWTPNRFWQIYFRTTETFDINKQGQLFLHTGIVYEAGKHNRLLINANLGSNNKDYSGFLGEQSQSFLLQHQLNF